MCSDLVRRITPAEVEFFRANGWVKLEGLLRPETAQHLLDVASKVFAETAPSGERRIDKRIGPDLSRQERCHDMTGWRDYYFPSADDVTFHDVAHSPDLGYTMQQLLGREIGVRYCVDLIMCKFPQTGRAGHGRTEWHQDLPGFPYDRVGNMACWIALDEVTPEQGSMRFLSGSQVEGPLGQLYGTGPDVLGVYPHLADRYPTSPPLHYRPGDATIHHGLMVHGAPANATDKPRWGYAVSCFPDDALYTGQPWPYAIGLDLQPGQPFPTSRFDLIYS